MTYVICYTCREAERVAFEYLQSHKDIIESSIRKGLYIKLKGGEEFRFMTKESNYLIRPYRNIKIKLVDDFIRENMKG